MRVECERIAWSRHGSEVGRSSQGIASALGGNARTLPRISCTCLEQRDFSLGVCGRAGRASCELQDEAVR